MKSIHDVLDEFRAASFDERHKGDLFEALTKKFLEIDPFYGSYFDKVWLYGDWASEAKLSKQDTGIDLVARISETGEIAAIQCKFYAEGAYLDKKEIDSFFTASGKEPFRERYIFSTTDNWSKNASDAVEGQQIPTTIIRVQDLDESGIDWTGFSLGNVTNLGLLKKKTPYPHQLEAIEAAKAHFASSDRGKMIMACGTGKTFTSLQIVQEMTPKGGTVLFLVPSLALLSQTLKEWKRESSVNFRAYAVCSDTKLSKQASTEDTRVADLAYPSTTNVDKLASHFNKGTNKELTVVFSTYQSIEVVAAAQKKGLPEFDLIVCDEAHRTTGVTLAGDDESNFVRVHDNDFIKGSKRLYMTATPRIYAESSKAKAEEASAVLASMDNETQFGQEFHRLNFGNAVSRGLLSDYKVLVLTVSETQVSKSLQKILTDGDELKLEDAIKIVGCYNGLRKRSANADDFAVDSNPMRTAVAFSRNIKDSKRIANLFGTVTKALNDEAKEKDGLIAEADHVDGTFNVMARNERLDWLKDTKTENTVRVLSNARCLSEGVDVPALDAVLFLNPRDSQVDVVQSVGRVMRKADGKQYGYVILPIAVPAGKSAEEALADNKNYKVVWQVLQALRAHDERFDALVNKIDLTGNTGGVIEIIDGSPSSGEGDWDGDSKPKNDGQVPLFDFDFADWKNAILAKIVQKVGERTYWEDWAKNVAEITRRFRLRIEALVEDPKSQITFSKFLKGLQDNLNPSVTKDDAIEMLSQHLITKPIFEALFADYSFSSENQISIVMQQMLDELSRANVFAEADELEGFYAQMQLTIGGITTSEGRQRVIKDLYEKFFRLAFPNAASQLGIVYTPNEVVDFMIRSVDDILGSEFTTNLGARGVEILDPFTGTGTFIARLLKLDVIPKDSLSYKFKNEIHANEIVLLAYYIAAINIEETYHSMTQGAFEPFRGIVLTDTFQINESGDADELPGLEVFPENNQKVKDQRARNIKVIIGNPPYALSQQSGNEEGDRVHYPNLDRRIQETYAARSSSSLTKSLNNSYIRAIRWASDRIGDEGIVCFVSNGGFIDDNSADGLRAALAEEFSSIYIYNLRGNQRTSGEASRKEGGKIFGSGSRNTIAISLLVKNPSSKSNGSIRYRDIGDYLSREEKLSKLQDEGSLGQVVWDELMPSEHGDWINQRDTEFNSFPSLSNKAEGPYSVFKMYSRSLLTSRDAWAYNFSRKRLVDNVGRMVDFYNSEVERLAESFGSKNLTENVTKEFVSKDASKISWDGSLVKMASRFKKLEFDESDIQEALYRPFTKHWVYLNKSFLNSSYQIPALFPKGVDNFGFIVPGPGSAVPFSALMTNRPSDLSQFGGQTNAHFFARYQIQEDQSNANQLFSDSELAAGELIDNITDECLTDFQQAFGEAITKDDIFYYVYGLLHSPEYRSKYESDIRKGLPRIPKSANFGEFSKAGRFLGNLHMNYEDCEEFPLVESRKTSGLLEVEKIRFGKSNGKEDKSRLILASGIELAGVPLDAYEYKIGSRSPIDWVMERFAVKTDKESGLLVNPNDWGAEHGDTDYILKLLKKVVFVCVESHRVVSNLPSLDLITKN
jgi:predicted helicase